MNGIKTKVISMTDIVNAGCINFKDVISVIESAFLCYKKGRVILPDKISQIFDEESQNRINCMPSTLLDENICGVKWVSVFPDNPKKFAVPNVSGVIILSELEKGYPKAIMDGALITAMRTACVGALGAKYLAKSNCKVMGIIGSGEQAKMHYIAMKAVRPQISICKIASRTIENEKKFVDDMKKIFPNDQYILCNNDFEKASQEADIIVTAVSCQLPLLKAHTIKPGAFYCHVGGWEDEYEVALMADKIVCDDWNAVKHRSQTISRLYSMGKLKDTDIYADLADVIDGSKIGRNSDEEFIYFNSVGLSFVDNAVANSFYTKVIKKGLGVEWNIQECSPFEAVLQELKV